VVQVDGERGKLGTTGKQVCSFSLDDIEELLFGGIRFSQECQLQQLTLDHLLSDLNQRIEDLEVLFTERDGERLHIEPVSIEDRHGIAPVRVCGRPAAADIRGIDIIVDEVALKELTTAARRMVVSDTFPAFGRQQQQY
jgi:hypothetical protein